MSILIKPIITGGATNDSELYNRYSFVVALGANKVEIKKAVEASYGVSVEKVVATIDRPNNHQGMVRPERKNSFESLPDFFETIIPISKTSEKKPIIRV